MNSSKIKKILYTIFIKYQGLLILLVALDQITKLLAVKYLKTTVEIFPWLVLKLQVNSGMAFSFGDSSPQWISALISLLAFLAIEYYLIFKKDDKKLFNLLLLIIAAGAIGNGIDRWAAVFGRQIVINGVAKSGVIDFIWPTFFANFNVADIYVTCACIVMLIYVFFSKEEKDKTHIRKKKDFDLKENENE